MYPQSKPTERMLEFPSLGFCSMTSFKCVLYRRPVFSGQIKCCLGGKKSSNIWIQLKSFMLSGEGVDYG